MLVCFSTVVTYALIWYMQVKSKLIAIVNKFLLLLYAQAMLTNFRLGQSVQNFVLQRNVQNTSATLFRTGCFEMKRCAEVWFLRKHSGLSCVFQKFRAPPSELWVIYFFTGIFFVWERKKKTLTILLQNGRSAELSKLFVVNPKRNHCVPCLLRCCFLTYRKIYSHIWLQT